MGWLKISLLILLAGCATDEIVISKHAGPVETVEFGMVQVCWAMVKTRRGLKSIEVRVFYPCDHEVTIEERFPVDSLPASDVPVVTIVR